MWLTHKITAAATAYACGCNLIESTIIMFGAILPDLLEYKLSRNNYYVWNMIHRRFTHYWLIYILLIILTLYVSNNYYSKLICFIWLGALVHIFQDSLTMGGVPLINPFKPHFRFGLFYVGTFKEVRYSFVYVCVCVSVIWLRLHT